MMAEVFFSFYAYAEQRAPGGLITGLDVELPLKLDEDVSIWICLCSYYTDIWYTYMYVDQTPIQSTYLSTVHVHNVQPF